MRPQRVRIIGRSSGWVDVEEAIDRDVDHAVPLIGAHAGQHGVIVYAGVVHQDLDGAGLERALERCARRRLRR